MSFCIVYCGNCVKTNDKVKRFSRDRSPRVQVFPTPDTEQVSFDIGHLRKTSAYLLIMGVGQKLPAISEDGEVVCNDNFLPIYW